MSDMFTLLSSNCLPWFADKGLSGSVEVKLSLTSDMLTFKSKLSFVSFSVGNFVSLGVAWNELTLFVFNSISSNWTPELSNSPFPKILGISSTVGFGISAICVSVAGSPDILWKFIDDTVI